MTVVKGRNAERPVKSLDIGESLAMDRALRRVLSEIDEGLHHGYFEFTLSCEVTDRDGDACYSAPAKLINS